MQSDTLIETPVPLGHDQIMAKIQWIATIGVWLSTAAVGLGLIVVFYIFGWAMTDPKAFALELSANLELTPPVSTMFHAQAIATAVIWMVTDILGVIMLMTVRQLFVGIRTVGIFTRLSAVQLRRIGWLLFSLGPVSIVLNAIAGSLMQYWANPTQVSVEISIEDADIYAIVIGLVIIAVSHIMVSAAQMSEDHNAIV